MFRKIRNKRGETITEALVTVLIIALSAAAFAAMVTTAVSMNGRANEATGEFYNELAAVDVSAPSSITGVVSIEGNEIAVQIHGDDDGLKSYTHDKVR